MLLDGEVLSHPFVIGELACGFLTKRAEILSLLATVPKVVIADHSEVLRLVDGERLYGRGLGWIDVHLLASALLSRAPIWTLDRILARVASAMGVHSETAERQLESPRRGGGRLSPRSNVARNRERDGGRQRH
jgi:predicted nucleic acid-binding protein